MKKTLAWIPMLFVALVLHGFAEMPAPTAGEPAARNICASGAEEPVPVLHYTFGQSSKSLKVKDRSGHGNNGTAVRPLRRVPGIAKGQWAARFDGISDCIRVQRSPSLEPKELTVDAWVRIDKRALEVNGGNTIVFKRNSAIDCNEDYCLEILTSRIVHMTVSNVRQSCVDSWTALSFDEWHHLAMTFRPGEAVVYVDGKENARMESRTGLAGLAHNAAADLFIGARDHAKFPMDRFAAFDLAEVRIWPVALDAKQIAVLYGAHAGQPGVAAPERNKSCVDTKEVLASLGVAAPESLVLHYTPPRSGRLTERVRDRSGCHNDGRIPRFLQRVGSPCWMAWHFNSAARDFIRVPRSPSLEPEAITVAAWVQVPGGMTPADAGAVVFKRNNSFHDNEDYDLEIFPDRRVRMTIGHSGGQKNVISCNPLAPNRWHHLAMTFRDGEMRLYVDGGIAGEGRFIRKLDHNPAADLFIGARDHASHPMDRFAWFDIADVRIWSEALEAQQIAALYQEFADRPRVARPADNCPPDPPTRKDDEPFICGTPSLPPSPPVAIDAPGIRSDALVLHYAFATPTDGTELRDRSGHQAKGSAPKPLEWVRGPGNLEGALRFDGVEDYIRVPRSPSMEADVVTAAAWVKLDSSRPLDHTGTVVFKRNTSFHQNEDYHLEIRPDRVMQAFCGDGAGGQRKIVAPAALAPDVWHHLAMTAGDGRIRLFVDGEPVAAEPWPHALVHNPEADLFIGAVDHARFPIGNHCPMDLADVRIWSAVLDESEIAALYREKALFSDVAKPGMNRPPEPPRVFPPWQPPEKRDGEGPLAAELRSLLEQGRRDEAACPEFLDALQRLLDRHGGKR